MAGENETVAETAPKVDEVAVKTDKEVIVEEEAAAEEKKEEKKDEEKKEEKKAEKPKKEPAPPVPTCHKKDWEQDVVYLFQVGGVTRITRIGGLCNKMCGMCVKCVTCVKCGSVFPQSRQKITYV